MENDALDTSMDMASDEVVQISRFEDLEVGQTVSGKVTNVVDFGAFVDLGIKENGLIHISEMADRFVKDPTEIVDAGDDVTCTVIRLEADRRRIGLSLKR